MSGSGRVLLAGAAALAVAALAACAQVGQWTGQAEPRQPMTAGALTHLAARLDGASEVPANFTYARGAVQATYDPATRTLAWTVTYDNLTGEVKAAHFHGPAAEGENAGVQVDIGAGGLASPMQGSATLTDAQAADLLAGRWYVNVHSSTYPDGEIRGWVKPTGGM
ncbi:MAG: CHRD domain-containing protein [Rhodospirillaceae bacterium]|nr:CHRD domain-containing protein [Rhodospirillaceae bacterium]